MAQFFTGKCSTLTCPANKVQSNDPNQCGAVVNYSDPMAGGGIICGAVTCSPPKGSFFPVGTTTVVCNAPGTPANPDCTFTVTVTDTQPPVITCPANVTTVAAPACPASTSKLVTFATPTASDNCPGVTTVCNPPSGSTFPLGVTTVTCTAKDAANNTATCSFTVNFAFNACIQDDSNSGNVILINTATGAYRICCNGAVIATGVGTVARQGCDVTLQHNEGTRRVLAKWSSATFKGSGTINLLGSTLTCTIIDRDIRNNSCNCQ